MNHPRPFDAGDLAPDLYHCSGCSYCVDAVWPQRGMNHVCATLEHHDRSPAYSGMGYLATARALVEDEALDPMAVAKRAFACTQCGNCEAVCPIGMRPAAANQALRRWLADAAALPAAVSALHRQIVDAGNRYGAGSAPAVVAAADHPVAVALFADCTLRQQVPGEYEAMLALFQAAGLGSVARDGGACCGAALAALGFETEGDAWREQAVAGIGEVDTLIVAGGDCRKHLAETGQARVVSFTDWLLGAIETGRIALERRDAARALPSIRLLESCQLRGSGDEAAFLRLLQAHGLGIADDTAPNAHAVCCGAGGGMAQLEPASAARMARARLAVGEAASGEPAILYLTLDPVCQGHLQAVDPDAEVAGPASLLLRCFNVRSGA